MSLATVIRLRRKNAEKGIGLPGDNDHILNVARRLRDVIDAPVLGGIAVYLHGVLRATDDLDLYTTDRQKTADQLLALGARWDKKRREHVLDHVSIHTITPEDARHQVGRTSLIDGVRTVSLKDLIAIKLLCGLNNSGRSKDIGDVESLIRAIPLDKRFAGKLPTELRAAYKKLVDGVRANEKRSPPDARF